MSFKVLGVIAAAFISYAGCAETASADIIYDLNLGPSAVGTIKTDGTIGILQTSNILDFNITLTTVGSTTVTGPQSGFGYIHFDVVGPDFTANATGLFFDFSFSSYLIFLGGDGYLCFNGSPGLCDGNTSSVSVFVAGSGAQVSALQGP
jgi:hypothetical protein